MEIRSTVQRFPRVAFLLILGLAAALVTMLALSFGVWRAGPAASSAPASAPAAQVQHTQDRSTPDGEPPPPQLQQRPDAQDRNPQFTLPQGPMCSWQQGGACSTTP